ncbi:glycosyltransferase family 2 protein [Perkinsela sp. CCAP 1560/4]|nr:glycosyltransferase family 2 protein [Perkinsela sp. CCAP 1560/4]|eukprot:KNH06414.1 glycosyltransferase family 2 protein [Perkinsela sp. CCAP 1560/4]
MKPSLSVVIPTFKEVDNIRKLIPRLVQAFEKVNACEKPSSFEIIIVDDNSKDGIEEVVKSFKNRSIPVSLFVRENERGLSSAVIHGMIMSLNDVCLVMDADFQHPPDIVPKIYLPFLARNIVFVSGRRKTNKLWPFYRRVISSLASAMAFPLTGHVCHDPMTGLFAVSRTVMIAHLSKINALGFKIALEILVKCDIAKRQSAEIEYQFGIRSAGASKLDQKVIFAYILQLCNLYLFKLKRALQVLFILVGALWMKICKVVRNMTCTSCLFV